MRWPEDRVRWLRALGQSLRRGGGEGCCRVSDLFLQFFVCRVKG